MSRKLIAVGLCLCVIIGTLIPLSVFADPDDPDGVNIEEFFVNRNLLETGDWLIYIHYDVDYTVAGTPDDPINQNYIFVLQDGATVLGLITPYPYKDLGYNHGVASWYFDAATITALGMIWGTEYTISINQNPATFITTPQNYPFTLPASAYTALTTNEENEVQLASNIIALAGTLEPYWSLDLLTSQDTGITLSSAGEVYFRGAIPGSQAMAPLAFFLQQLEIDTGTRTWDTDLSEIYQARLWGADGIEGTPDDNWMWALGIAPTADLLNIPAILLIGLAMVAVCVVLIWQSQKRFETAVPGYVGSLIVLMCGGMLALGFTVVALAALAITLVGGWFLLMRKA